MKHTNSSPSIIKPMIPNQNQRFQIKVTTPMKNTAPRRPKITGFVGQNRDTSLGDQFRGDTSSIDDKSSGLIMARRSLQTPSRSVNNLLNKTKSLETSFRENSNRIQSNGFHSITKPSDPKPTKPSLVTKRLQISLNSVNAHNEQHKFNELFDEHGSPREGIKLPHISQNNGSLCPQKIPSYSNIDSSTSGRSALRGLTLKTGASGSESIEPRARSKVDFRERIKGYVANEEQRQSFADLLKREKKPLAASPAPRMSFEHSTEKDTSAVQNQISVQKASYMGININTNLRVHSYGSDNSKMTDSPNPKFRIHKNTKGFNSNVKQAGQALKHSAKRSDTFSTADEEDGAHKVNFSSQEKSMNSNNSSKVDQEQQDPNTKKQQAKSTRSSVLKKETSCMNKIVQDIDPSDFKRSKRDMNRVTIHLDAVPECYAQKKKFDLKEIENLFDDIAESARVFNQDDD